MQNADSTLFSNAWHTHDMVLSCSLQERKATKLERKKQPKENETAAAFQPSSSSSEPASEPCTSSAQSAAQPTRTSAAPAPDPDPAQPAMASQGNDAEANDNAPPQIAQRAESDDIPAVNEEDGASSATKVASAQMAADQLKDLDKQDQQEQAAADNQDEPHAEHAEPAEAHDVLHELEHLQQLPDMPKHDVKDDLAGLFKAAFATCHAEMSPRGAPPLSPFSAHGQDGEEEDYSLYDDADQAIDGDEPGEVILDASDAEKEERSGERAKPLLEGFMGDAVATTLRDTPQVCKFIHHTFCFLQDLIKKNCHGIYFSLLTGLVSIMLRGHAQADVQFWEQSKHTGKVTGHR